MQTADSRSSARRPSSILVLLLSVSDRRPSFSARIVAHSATNGRRPPIVFLPSISGCDRTSMSQLFPSALDGQTTKVLRPAPADDAALSPRWHSAANSLSPTYWRRLCKPMAARLNSERRAMAPENRRPEIFSAVLYDGATPGRSLYRRRRRRCRRLCGRWCLPSAGNGIRPMHLELLLDGDQRYAVSY